MIHHAGMWILPPTPHTGHHFVAPTSEIFMLRPRIHERPDKKDVRRRDRGQRPTATEDPDPKRLRWEGVVRRLTRWRSVA